MSSADGGSAGRDEVLTLIHELLDAHADTVELGTASRASRHAVNLWSADLQTLRIRAHLEYLRALQRKGREILARSELSATSHSARAGLR